MNKTTNESKTKSTDSFQLFGWRLSGQAQAALVAALLAVVGSIATLAYSEWRTDVNGQITASRQAANEYEDLGDVPRRAGEFIRTQNEGSPEDVRAVARVLRSMMIALTNERYTVAQFQGAIGGRAKYWQRAFVILSSKQSPVSIHFSLGESEIFKSLARDLEVAVRPEGSGFGTASAENAAAAQDRLNLPSYH
ncbi:MAG: hypothetical protein WBO17_06440 [Sphingorhabdus sp.]